MLILPVILDNDVLVVAMNDTLYDASWPKALAALKNNREEEIEDLSNTDMEAMTSV